MTYPEGRMRRRRSALAVAGATALLLTCIPTTAFAASNAAGDAAEADWFKPTVDANGEITATLGTTANDVNIFEVWIETTVDTDGDGKKDRLHAEMRVPKVAGPTAKMPTVIQASPYYGGIWAVPQHNPYKELWDPSQPKTEGKFGDWNRPGDGDSPNYGASGYNYWLQRGFAFMKLSALGTEKSTGCPQMLNRTEAEATKAAIQWLTSSDGVKAYDKDGNEVSAKDWSAGKAGMTGTSYDGALPMLASTTGVKGLDAIAPMAPVSSFYDYYHHGGGMYGPDGYQGEDLDNYVLALRPKGNTTCTATALDFAKKQDRDSGDYNDFWDERNMLNHVDKVKAATLIGHGQGDLNVRVGQSTEWYQALQKKGVPTKLYLHQYTHINVGSAPGGLWTNNLNRWFGHYLYGVNNGVEKEPGSRIQLEDKKTWIDEPSWPAPGTDNVTLYPTTGGAGVGGMEAETRTGAVETKKFQDDSKISLQTHVNAATSDNRLLYQTKPLAKELRLSGKATAKLQIALDRPAANITMAIADRDPATGKSKIIARSWTDPQNRTNERTTEAVVPGTSYGLNLTFVPTDYRIPAGHTLALLVASSDTSTSLLPPTTTGLTVDTSATSITLPVTGSTAALRAALGDPAAPAVALASPSVEAPGEQSVSGVNFAPNTDLTIDTGVAGAEPVAVRTDDKGAFTVKLPVVKTSAAGDRTVKVLAGRATLAEATYTVTVPDPAVLTPETEGAIEVPEKVTAGKSMVVTVKESGVVGAEYSVWLHSSPVKIGTAKLAADNTLTVTVPADAVGDHKVSVRDADNFLVGWDSTTVVKAEVPVEPTKPVDPTTPTTPTKPGTLPETGAEVSPLWLGGLALLGAGAALVLVRRRRVTQD